MCMLKEEKLSNGWEGSNRECKGGGGGEKSSQGMREGEADRASVKRPRVIKKRVLSGQKRGVV